MSVNNTFLFVYRIFACTWIPLSLYIMVDKKEIKFNVVKEENSVTFVIVNSFVNHGLSLLDMERQNISSKGEGRGLGLNNVKEILSRYENVNKVTEIKDNYFIQTLIIESFVD